MGQVTSRSLTEIDFVGLSEPADELTLEPRALTRSNSSRETRDQVLRHKMLEPDER